MLDYDEVSYADILEALASPGTTLVEDPVSDSTLTYYESLARPSRSPDPTATEPRVSARGVADATTGCHHSSALLEPAGIAGYRRMFLTSK